MDLIWTELLFWVDKIDSGQITEGGVFSRMEPVFLIGRLIGSDQIDINLHILELQLRIANLVEIHTYHKKMMRPHLN